MPRPTIKTVTTYFLEFFPVIASRFLSVSGVRHIKYVPDAAVSVPNTQWWKNPREMSVSEDHKP
jgi:hypothetical protein